MEASQVYHSLRMRLLPRLKALQHLQRKKTKISFMPRAYGVQSFFVRVLSRTIPLPRRS